MIIDDQHPVGVTVEGDTEICAVHGGQRAQRVRIGRPAIPVDVEAVGVDADGDDFRPQLPQDFGRHAVGRTIGAIKHHLEPVDHVLRGKLEPDPRNPELILTVRGIGYSSQRVGEVATA